MVNKRIDQPTGVETVGHEWDGIEELNNPLPRWWLMIMYASIVFAIGYVIVYPAIPLAAKGTEGIWGWTSRGQLAAETKAADAKRAQLRTTLAGMPIDQINGNPDLMRQAVQGGKAAFRVNCVQCHGAGAGGNIGYPNLADDDWLWGGSLAEIERTITFGVRQPGEAETRSSLMPSFGRDAILNPAQVDDAASFVRSLSGREKPGAASARGATIFAANCAVCHGPTGGGNRQFGAPKLGDAIWLYGGSRDQVVASIRNAHAGVMPAWRHKLEPATIKMLAAYVHSLGGGEAFAAPQQTQAASTNAQP